MTLLGTVLHSPDETTAIGWYGLDGTPVSARTCLKTRLPPSPAIARVATDHVMQIIGPDNEFLEQVDSGRPHRELGGHLVRLPRAPSGGGGSNPRARKHPRMGQEHRIRTRRWRPSPGIERCHRRCSQVDRPLPPAPRPPPTPVHPRLFGQVSLHPQASATIPNPSPRDSKLAAPYRQ